MTRVMKSTLVRELLNEKTAVFTVDLRGFGETRDAGSNAKYQSHSHRTANVATHIGLPLLGQRVGDLLSVVDFLEGISSERVGDIRLVGIHAAAPAVLHAAALQQPDTTHQRPPTVLCVTTAGVSDLTPARP